MPQTCKSCGTVVDDNAVYCPNCHTILPGEHKAQPGDENEFNKMAKKAFVYSILCIITALIAAIILSLFTGMLFVYSLFAILPWGAFFAVGWIYLIKARKAKAKVFIVLAVILFLLSLAALPAIGIPLRTYICGSLF